MSVRFLFCFVLFLFFFFVVFFIVVGLFVFFIFVVALFVFILCLVCPFFSASMDPITYGGKTMYSRCMSRSCFY